jgi:hypothetical protein
MPAVWWLWVVFAFAGMGMLNGWHKMVVSWFLGLALAGSVVWEFNSHEVYGHSDVQEGRKSFSEFYMTTLFSSELLELIGDRRVMSVGLHPAVAQMHGVKTGDFYLPNYDIEYLKKFQFVFRDYFLSAGPDERGLLNWGSRCYVPFSERESGFEMMFDSDALHHLGVTCLLSPKPLLATGSPLKLIWSGRKGKDELYLYELQSRQNVEG